MARSASLLSVAFREVRHFQPDDCLHWERLEFRGELHQWAIPVHRHEALHQFNLLDSGSVVATFDGAAYTLTAPAAWMVTPGVLHGFTYERGSTGHVVSVPSTVLQQSVAASPNLTRRLAQRVVVTAFDGQGALDELRDLFAKIEGEFQAQRAGRAEALQAHAALLGLWFLRCETAGPGAGSSRPVQDALVERYRALLETNFRKHWPVRTYAAALNVTPDHLSRRCRAVTGLGALELAQQRLYLEARRLLAYTEDTVGEIAHQLGFDDPGYFSRLFAKGVGQSPSCYRSAIADGLGVPPSPGRSQRQPAPADRRMA